MKSFEEIEMIAKSRDDFKELIRAPDGMALLLGRIRIVLSNGGGWDHVSVSLSNRTPRYQEMKMVKRMCFKSDEWAMELHPPPSSYVSVHPYVLHLWRPQNGAIPTPDPGMV
jgi:hypothetical protein